MTERERWIVYPLLFLALGVSLRDKMLYREEIRNPNAIPKLRDVSHLDSAEYASNEIERPITPKAKLANRLDTRKLFDPLVANEITCKRLVVRSRDGTREVISMGEGISGTGTIAVYDAVEGKKDRIPTEREVLGKVYHLQVRPSYVDEPLISLIQDMVVFGKYCYHQTTQETAAQTPKEQKEK